MVEIDIFLDDDGYPTKNALEAIEKWNWNDARGWFKFILRSSTESTDKSEDAVQTSLDTDDPLGGHGSQTSSLSGDAPVSGLLSVCDPLTPGGGQQTQTSTGQNNDDDDIPL